MRRAFKYRLYPTPKQAQALRTLLLAARTLYNAALEQRRYAWTAHRTSPGYLKQAAQLKEARDADPGLKLLNYSACQNILRRLEKAFQAFSRRVKEGEAPGYPRFKAAHRFGSIEFPKVGDGVKPGKRLYVQNVGEIKIKLHRPIGGTIKTMTLKRSRLGKWYAVFSCDDVEPRRYPEAEGAVGLDLGLQSYVALSTGERVENPRWYRRTENRLKRAQESLSRTKRGSRRRERARRSVAKLSEKAGNQRRDFQHQLAFRLVKRYATLVVEDLKPLGMVKHASRGLAKSIQDASWASFVLILSSKAEEAGRKIIKVRPEGTSSRCSRCGRSKPKPLSERVHRCTCGLCLDRDVNAARNILALGLGRSLQASA